MASTIDDDEPLCDGGAAVLCAVCLRRICSTCGVQFWVLVGDDPDVWTPVCWRCSWRDLFAPSAS